MYLCMYLARAFSDREWFRSASSWSSTSRCRAAGFSIGVPPIHVRFKEKHEGTGYNGRSPVASIRVRAESSDWTTGHDLSSKCASLSYQRAIPYRARTLSRTRGASLLYIPTTAALRHWSTYTDLHHLPVLGVDHGASVGLAAAILRSCTPHRRSWSGGSAIHRRGFSRSRTIQLMNATFIDLLRRFVRKLRTFLIHTRAPKTAWPMDLESSSRTWMTLVYSRSECHAPHACCT